MNDFIHRTLAMLALAGVLSMLGLLITIFAFMVVDLGYRLTNLFLAGPRREGWNFLRYCCRMFAGILFAAMGSAAPTGLAIPLIIAAIFFLFPRVWEVITR